MDTLNPKRPVVCPCGFAYDANRFPACPQASNHTRAEEAARVERLTEAAPAMLAALRELVAEFDHTNANGLPWDLELPDTGGIVLARIAIAKAEGEIRQ